MGLVGFEPVQETAQVIGKIAEPERLGRVVAVEIAPRVPGQRAKTPPKMGQLTRPIQSIAADAVQENNDRPTAFNIVRNRNRSICPSCFSHAPCLRFCIFCSYIASKVSIPSKSKPVFKYRAVRSHNKSRVGCRSCGALRTECAW